MADVPHGIQGTQLQGTEVRVDADKLQRDIEPPRAVRVHTSPKAPARACESRRNQGNSAQVGYPAATSSELALLVTSRVEGEENAHNDPSIGRPPKLARNHVGDVLFVPSSGAPKASARHASGPGHDSWAQGRLFKGSNRALASTRCDGALPVVEPCGLLCY